MDTFITPPPTSLKKTLNSQIASITQTTGVHHRGYVLAKTGASLIKDHSEPDLGTTGVLIRNREMREETGKGKKSAYLDLG